jgi:hypothetical protein
MLDDVRTMTAAAATAEEHDFTDAVAPWDRVFGPLYRPVRLDRRTAEGADTVRRTVARLRAQGDEAADVIAALAYREMAAWALLGRVLGGKGEEDAA